MNQTNCLPLWACAPSVQVDFLLTASATDAVDAKFDGPTAAALATRSQTWHLEDCVLVADVISLEAQQMNAWAGFIRDSKAINLCFRSYHNVTFSNTADSPTITIPKIIRTVVWCTCHNGEASDVFRSARRQWRHQKWSWWTKCDEARESVLPSNWFTGRSKSILASSGFQIARWRISRHPIDDASVPAGHWHSELAGAHYQREPGQGSAPIRSRR